MDVNQCPRCKTRFRGELAACPIDGEALIRIEDPLVGRTIAGRYLIEDKIGGGGMGVVYRGRHQVIDRAVAIKFLHQRFTRDPTSRKRFLGEARAANQIDHENIIDITDFGETEDGLVYLVMEHLQGRSLDQEISGRALHPSRALHIAVQIAGGLARAHELDVIHRDVKPANVFLLRRRGDADFVKLLDFGIARFERELRITDRGALMGTPEYMAPEQLSHGEVNPATDLYALGCVIFEMLTGRPPFVGNTSEVLIKHMREPPTAPSHIIPSVAPALDAVVLRLLNKDPARRHRDAFHLVDDLQVLLDQTPSTASVPAPSALESGPARGTKPQAPHSTLHAPTDLEEWRERIARYGQMLAQAYPRGDTPGTLQVAMQRMQLSLGRMTQLRAEIDDSARQLVGREDDVRGLRLRIGRALDELSRDESKLARALEDEAAQAEQSERSLRETMHSLLIRAKTTPTLLDAAAVSVQALTFLRDLHAGLLHLAEQESRLAQAQTSLGHKRAAHEDLCFQLAQLKGRLATLNAESSVTLGKTQERVQQAEAELRAELNRLVSETECVSVHLRARPELAATQRS